MKLLLICLAVFVATFAGGLLVTQNGPPSFSTGVPMNGPTATSVGHVVDGDTFALGDGDRVRILNIDTAEMPPRSRCEREEQLAFAAKARLAVLLAGGEVRLTRHGRDRDRFDRLLRKVSVDGRDVGDQLVREGLAQRWEGHKATWC